MSDELDDSSGHGLGVRFSEVDDGNNHGESTHNVLATNDAEEIGTGGLKPKSKSFYIPDIFTNRSSFFINSKDSDGFNDVMEAGQLDAVVPPLLVTGHMGLWGHYAASGLLFGISGALGNLCTYRFHGEANLCANSYNIVFFPWSFKIILSFLTYGVQPLGSRYKAWMMMGWGSAIGLLIILAAASNLLSATDWLIVLLVSQFFVCLADVQADGYVAQLSHNQPQVHAIVHSLGFILRFGFGILGGIIQASILNSSNGVSPEDCSDRGWRDCWRSGVNINGYYGVIVGVTVALMAGLPFLEEIDSPSHPRYTLNVYLSKLWSMISSYPSFMVLFSFMGITTLTNFRSTVNFYIQYDVLKLTNFQSGVSSAGVFLAIPLAIYAFNAFLSGFDWRLVQLFAIVAWSCIGLIWIIVYNNDSDLLYPWFTVFIDVVQVCFLMLLLIRGFIFSSL
jgi:MFS family permease